MIIKKRSLSLWLCIALVVGNVIGSGAYILPSSTAEYGSINIVGWILTATAAMSVACVLSRLSILFPSVGGPYAYVHKVFPGTVAGLVAWSYWIAVWSGNAAVAMIFADYASNLFPVLSDYKLICAVSILWFFTFINSFTIHFSGMVQFWLMIMKIFPILLVIFFSVWQIDLQNFTPVFRGDYSLYTSLSKTYMLVWWSFLGLESATIPAEYVIKPNVNIPLSTLMGTAVVGVLYLCLNVVSIGVLSIDKLANDGVPLLSISRVIWGDWGRYLIFFGVSAACLGVINGFTILQGQVPRSAAKDHLFPKFMGSINTYAVPILSMYLGTVLSSSLLIIPYLINPETQVFEFAASISIFTTMIAYAFCAVVEYLYRKFHHQDAPPVWLLVLSLLVIIASLSAIVFMDWQVIAAGIMMLFFGLPLVWYVQHNKN